ncbi:MAG TPA: FRG domain-containing protein [Gemmatimonadaceae bacterium]|nr:FRG domain-containing protein [Gemmatimonadaceae bacterium]
MPIREIAIRSLGELIDEVTPRAPDPVTGRRRDTGVYRGASDAGCPLYTSLDRLGGTHPAHTKAELEAHILRNFIRYSRPYLPALPASDWELLVTAQHHGVPTRLLDWSYSPLVATFFATRDSRARADRAVWRLDWQRVHEAFGLPELALLIDDLEHQLGGDEPLTPWRLFAAKAPKPFACMLEPPSIDSRIVVQAAAFTLCSDRTQPFDHFLEAHGLAETLTKLVIVAGDVARIRDQLDLASVDERRLFPDLDGVAAALRRYYG